MEALARMVGRRPRAANFGGAGSTGRTAVQFGQPRCDRSDVAVGTFMTRRDRTTQSIKTLESTGDVPSVDA